MRLNKQYLEVPIYQPGKSIEEVKEELGIKQIIKLASNENPYGASKKVAERIGSEMDSLSIYPDGSGRKLKRKIAGLYGIDPKQIILGNGSDEIIQYLSRIYLNPEKEVIAAIPTFPMYRTNALMEGAQVVEVPLKDGRHDLDKMAEAISEQTAIIWICNPNNPTGTIVSEEELIKFLNKVPDDILVVIDEAYYEYVTDKQYPDTLNLMANYPNLMILRTFSKIYGLAALRIGYGIAHHQVIEDLHRVKEPFNANRIAQISAEEAISDQAFVQSCKQLNKENKTMFLEGLKALEIEYYPSEANFVLVKHGMDDDFLFNFFLMKGIIIRPGNKLGINGTFRITIGSRDQMIQVLDALKELK